MAIPDNRLSTVPIVGNYLPPDDIDHTLNEDWEQGPIGLEDTTAGLNNQAWHLTYAAGEFTVTPSDTGSPEVIETGEEPIDSVQCSFAFDQNGRISITWVDSSDQGHLYWYDSSFGDFIVTDFATPVWGLALCLDDKRDLEISANDILLWYTLPAAGLDHYILYHRRQRDRFEVEYEMADPVWPFIHKLGMNDGLRVQISLSTASP